MVPEAAQKGSLRKDVFPGSYWSFCCDEMKLYLSKLSLECQDCCQVENINPGYGIWCLVRKAIMHRRQVKHTKFWISNCKKRVMQTYMKFIWGLWHHLFLHTRRVKKEVCHVEYFQVSITEILQFQFKAPLQFHK